MKKNANIMEKTKAIQILKQLLRVRRKGHVAFMCQGDFWEFNFNLGKKPQVAFRTNLKLRLRDLKSANPVTWPQSLPNDKP